jgi:hypothetical protein
VPGHSNARYQTAEKHMKFMRDISMDCGKSKRSDSFYSGAIRTIQMKIGCKRAQMLAQSLANLAQG